MSEIGIRIRNRREQLKISADTLAELLGISKSTIYRYENGDIEKVPSNILAHIAKILDTSVEYLMNREDNATNVRPKIMTYYESLNDMGKIEAEKRIEELTHIEKYTSLKNKQLEGEFSKELCSKFTSVEEAKMYLKEQKRLAALKKTDTEPNDVDILIMANTIWRDSHEREQNKN